MKKSKFLPTRKAIIPILTLAFITVSYSIYSNILEESNQRLEQAKHLSHIKRTLAEGFLDDSEDLPVEIDVDDKKYDVDYTIDEKFSNYIERQLKRYRSDYSSVVVIDNNTGEIISSVDYKRKGRKVGRKLAFTATHPAASIVKVITAASLIENHHIEKEDIFAFRGKSTTLYKYQLKNKKDRWTRYIPFEKAFALSNNVVFGKAAINNLKGGELVTTAQKFGFNQKLMDSIEVSPSTFKVPEDQYNLAELASGFNRDTMISPLHGAMIASIVANEGKYVSPKIFKSVTNNETKEVYNLPVRGAKKNILKEEVVDELAEMMTLTVEKGTARSAFRRYLRKMGKKLEIGGKTGSITGGLPHGKRDWFIAYAKPKNAKEDKGISICVMNINVKKWYIKSTVLAQKVIERYFKQKNI